MSSEGFCMLSKSSTSYFAPAYGAPASFLNDGQIRPILVPASIKRCTETDISLVVTESALVLSLVFEG